jgi:hypothetical protein
MTLNMKYVASSKKVDLRTWGIADEFSLKIGEDMFRHISEAIQQQLLCTPPRLDLPFYWGEDDGRVGKCPTDPLTIYLALELGEEDDEINFQISFEVLVDDVIEAVTNIDGQTDKDGRENLDRLVLRLRQLVDRLDAVPLMRGDEVK